MSTTKRYWFKAKRYGWGWTPASWQGWTILFIWVAVFAGFTAAFNVFMDFHWLAFVLASLVGLAWVAALVWISYKTGEKPAWRWGDKQSK